MATTPQNLFDELKTVLNDFKTFLDTNVPVIKPAIQTIAGMIPQVNEVIDKLVGLMSKLKTAIQNLNPGAIAGDVLGKVTQFSTMTKSFLAAAKNLLPDEAATIDDVLSVVDVVGSLPSLDAVKQEILGLVDAISAHLASLKAA